MKSKRLGFTIVELLTVLVIIAILVALLIPALKMVRNMAKETAQEAQLITIGLALTAFKNDYGNYPPSDWHPVDSPDYGGAQKLAEALLGRDLLGFHPQSNWDATDTTYYPPNPSVDNLNDRMKRYLELATANAFKLEDLFNNTADLEGDTFVLCDVFGVRRLTVGTEVVRAGTPILYYRANTSSKNFDQGSVEERIYNGYDNLPLILLGKLTDDGSYGGIHEKLDTLGEFYNDYINDPKVTEHWPYRPDSYILITAGADGEYGTSDDICNF